MFLEIIKSVELQNKLSIKNKNKPTLFDMIMTKPVNIVFEKTIDKIKQVNLFYVTP